MIMISKRYHDLAQGWLRPVRQGQGNTTGGFSGEPAPDRPENPQRAATDRNR